MHAEVLVPTAPGCEEIEAVSVIDVLRRAELDVTVARVPAGDAPDSLLVTASRGVMLQADTQLAHCHDREFALAIVAALCGEELREDLARQLLLG